MKTLKTVSLVSGFIGLAGVLLAPAALSAPGKGWDTFNLGQGDPIPAASKDYVGTSSAASAGKGWDSFNMKQGDPIPAASKDFKGSSSGASAGKGWDVFNMGLGDKP
jgi:hypothetical protein